MKTIIFTLDCVRFDHLGCNGNAEVYTPTIDALAADGVNFKRHYTAAPWTNPSVASFVTGIYPHRLNTFSYKTVFPPDVKTMFDYWNERAGGNACFLKNFHFFGGHEGIEIVDYVWHTHAILDWLEKNDDRDYVLYLHYWNTHLPYFTRYSADGYFAGLHDIVALLNSGRPADVAKVQRLYRHSIERASEEFVYAVAEKLDKLGSLKDANLVITADHGESFGDREGPDGKVDVFGMHGRHLYEEVVHVPLVMKGPGLPAGRTVDDLTRSIDVLPTLLALNGWRPDPGARAMDGRDLLGGGPASEDLYLMTTYLDRFDDDVISEPFEKYGYLKDGWKLIHDRDAKTFELYDLGADPDERNDRAAAEPDRLAAMKAGLAAEIDLDQTRTADEEAEIARRMKDLGYFS